MNNIQPVILCGGSGTRLWPLSRKAMPKQFVPLIDNKSLLQLTLERAAQFGADVVCVASDEHRFFVAEAMAAAGVTGSQILEPMGRNTGAAMAAAALNAPPEALLLFCPADHFIPDAAGFAASVRAAMPTALQGYFVTFGVQPSHPSTAYGYIQQGESLGAGLANKVSRFVEKPALALAEQLLLAGGYFWNAGIFLVEAKTLLDALELYAADILASCRKAVNAQTTDGAFTRLGQDAFAACRSDSIDYAVLEHHPRIAVQRFDGAWSDVGNWGAVADLYAEDKAGNRIHGRGFAIDSKNTFIHAQDRPVVALGTEDLLIIDNIDALLVTNRRYAEGVKGVVAALEAEGIAQATLHRTVARPWGVYDSVDAGDGFLVKRITVKPGARLSLQMHHHRAEHWVVVRGTARVTRGDNTFELGANESTYIPCGETHRLENPGTTPLEIIEDDIVRLDDSYGRMDHGSSAPTGPRKDSAK